MGEGFRQLKSQINTAHCKLRLILNPWVIPWVYVNHRIAETFVKFAKFSHFVVRDSKFNMRTKNSGKTYEVKHGGMPFKGDANTPYRKAVRDMIERSGMRF
jgi:hypothetical protein